MVISGIWIPEKMENSGSPYHSRRCYRVQFSIVYTYQEISSGVHIPRAILLDNHRHHPLSYKNIKTVSFSQLSSFIFLQKSSTLIFKTFPNLIFQLSHRDLLSFLTKTKIVRHFIRTLFIIFYHTPGKKCFHVTKFFSFVL